jgi:TetR/AcrR family transcriptional regulator
MSTQNRKSREKEERLRLITDAAEKVMTAHGLHGLNMDLVAQEAELAKGTLYLYFKSKDELLAELNLKARLLLLKEFQNVTQKADTPLGQLQMIVMANYTFYKRYPLYYELVSLFEGNNKFFLTQTPESQRVGTEIIEFIVNLAQQAKQQGTFNPDIDPEYFAWCFWGMNVGITQLMKVLHTTLHEHHHLPEEVLLKNFVHLLLDGIRK